MGQIKFAPQTMLFITGITLLILGYFITAITLLFISFFLQLVNKLSLR